MSAIYDARMAHDVGVIQAILAELHQDLVEQLHDAGVPALEHIIVAIGPDGHAYVQGNVDLNSLKSLARKLIDLVPGDLHGLSGVVGLH